MNNSVDLVYLWVDGNDPQWLKKRSQCLKTPIDTVERYIDNNELKYSLRSVEKHLPWIRKIFIITDNQIPNFIDTSNPKITIIDHTEIIPQEFLPTYNSVVIEFFIHNITDLSEKFLYMNDDFFINADLDEDFFFQDDLPIVRMSYSPLMKLKLQLKRLIKRPINNYRLSIENAYQLIDKKYQQFHSGMPHHNVDSYLKSDFKKTCEIFKNELSAVYSHRVRHKDDIQRLILQYDALSRNRAVLSYVNRNISCRIPMQKPDYQRYITRYNPKLFCLNDTERTTDADRARVVPFLESLFPNKSSFER